MNILKTLFSPKGEVSQTDMFAAGGLMVVLALIKNLGMFTFQIPVFGLIFLFFLPMAWYVWSVLWVKRYRDIGESGWMALLPIAAFIALFCIVSGVLLRGYFGEAMVVYEQDPGNQAAIEEIAMKHIPAYMSALPWITAITSAFVLVAFNLIIRRKSITPSE